MKRLLAAVSPSSEYLYEGKADVVYLQVWSTSERLVVEMLTIGAIQVHFLSFPLFGFYSQRPHWLQKNPTAKWLTTLTANNWKRNLINSRTRPTPKKRKLQRKEDLSNLTVYRQTQSGQYLSIFNLGGVSFVDNTAQQRLNSANWLKIHSNS